MKKTVAALRELGAAFIECFLPQSCSLCQKRIPSSERLCASCSAGLIPSVVFFCPLCRFRAEKGSELPGCSEHSYTEGRAAMRTGKAILTLIHRLKYSGERELAPLAAKLIVKAGIVDEHFTGFNIMCPVPLFRTRERERGFNQSTEIARCIETDSGVPLVTDLLSRMQPTREQAKLPARLRRRNLLRSFAVTRPGLVEGKSVVLVDDVVTTGSTVAACIEALREAGVARVLVVSVVA